MRNYRNYERDILLHYHNLEYKRIVGLASFYTTEAQIKYLHKLNYTAILLCKEHCIVPYSALVEDNILSTIFSRYDYTPILESGYLIALLKENSPEEFLDKKKEQYKQASGLYGYFDNNALKTLQKQNVPVVKRDLGIGESIQKNWKNQLDESSEKSKWRKLMTLENAKLLKKLYTIPDRILDKGEGIIWPVVNMLLKGKSGKNNRAIREILNNIYFENYLNEEQIVTLKGLNFANDNFQLDSYRGLNFNHKIFSKLLGRLDIEEDIYSLNTSDFNLLKRSNEYNNFYHFFHSKFGPLNDNAIIHTFVDGLLSNYDLKNFKKFINKKNGLDKILETLNFISPSLFFDKKTDLQLPYSLPQTINSMKKFDVAILSALFDDEFESVKKNFSANWRSDVSDETKIYINTELLLNSGKSASLIATSQHSTGMVDAAIFSTEIISKFSPVYLMMPGVLAGKPRLEGVDEDNIDFGDIVVGTKLFMIDKGKLTNVGFEKELADCDTDFKLIQHIQYNKADILLKVKADLLKLTPDFKANKLKVHFSPIACSISVVNRDEYFYEKVTTTDRKTIALEMESYGVARACKIGNNGITKALIIKSIMDRTVDKNDEHKKLAALTSALFTKYVIQSLNDIPRSA